MTLKERFYIFMIGEVLDISLIELVKKSLESIKEPTFFSQFKILMKLKNYKQVLRQMFSSALTESEESSFALSLENQIYPYYSQSKGFLQMAENFNDCLGRAVLTAGFLQEYKLDLKLGEVLVDFFSRICLESKEEKADLLLMEILHYELPHLVVIIEGEIFDPLSALLPEEMKVEHEVEEFDLYLGLLNSCVVNFLSSQEHFSKSDLEEKKKFLQEVYDISGEKSSLVARNLAAIFHLLNQDVPEKILDNFFKQKSLETLLFQVIWKRRKKTEVLREIGERYGPNIFTVLNSMPNFKIILENLE